MADTRKHDILELMELRNNAQSSYWRDKFDEAIDKIAREGNQVRAERENLIKAVRGGDTRSIRKYQEKINKYIQDKTYGRRIS